MLAEQEGFRRPLLGQESTAERIAVTDIRVACPARRCSRKTYALSGPTQVANLASLKVSGLDCRRLQEAQGR